MSTRFEDYKIRKAIEYGDRLDLTDLARQFIPYFNSGKRIEVNFIGITGRVYETKRGYVGVTTGWRPSFILLLKSNSMGSSHLLSSKDIIVNVFNKTRKG